MALCHNVTGVRFFLTHRVYRIQYGTIYNMYIKTGLYLNLQKVHKIYIRMKIYHMRHKVTQNI